MINDHGGHHPPVTAGYITNIKTYVTHPHVHQVATVDGETIQHLTAMA